MSNPLMKDFHTGMASSLLNEFHYNKSNYYYFLGNSESQNISPTIELGSTLKDIDARTNIVFLKKITKNDVSLVTKRINWVSGESYDSWDHTKNMESKRFYCVTPENFVYKCLDKGSSVSTVMPTGKSIYAFRTSDGYLWKYMYSIPLIKINKFMNFYHIPVQKALTDSFYNKGSISEVSVISQGSGYNDVPQTYIEVTSETGSGAILIPYVSRTTGEILSVNIIDGGSDYVEPPTIEIFGEGGYGFYDNPTAIFSCVLYQGKIVRVNIEDPGKNYPIETKTTITVVDGDGNNASFYPVVYEGKIIDVIIENPGTDYTYINLRIDGVGTGASINPIIYTSDFSSDQSIIEQTAIKGAIFSGQITKGGSGYTSSTSCIITGDGSGAEARVTVNGNGSIRKVTFTKYGSNYTYANIVFNDFNRISGVNVDAEAYAVISPQNGHGYDAVKELYANTLAISSSLSINKPIDSIDIKSYKQFGIIKNPTNVLSGKFSTEDFSYLLYKVRVNSYSNLVIGEILIQNSIKYKVIFINNFTVYLQQMGVKYVNLIGSIRAESDNNRIYRITSILSSPTINKYSGDLIYVSDEDPLSFGDDRGLVVKTFLKF